VNDKSVIYNTLQQIPAPQLKKHMKDEGLQKLEKFIDHTMLKLEELKKRVDEQKMEDETEELWN